MERNEPDLNTNLDNDPRDSTTPAAMVATMEKLLTGDSLTAVSRGRLITWLVGNKTADRRIRAGSGPAWKFGDKTGTGENGASNDIAIVWPAGQTSTPPILIAFDPFGIRQRPDQFRSVRGSFRISCAMSVLASGSNLHNTGNLIHRHQPGRHMAAPLSFLASAALLFRHVLPILLSLRRN